MLIVAIAARLKPHLECCLLSPDCLLYTVVPPPHLLVDEVPPQLHLPKCRVVYLTGDVIPVGVYWSIGVHAEVPKCPH